LIAASTRFTTFGGTCLGQSSTAPITVVHGTAPQIFKGEGLVAHLLNLAGVHPLEHLRDGFTGDGHGLVELRARPMSNGGSSLLIEAHSRLK
jgi:hypothetical protein